MENIDCSKDENCCECEKYDKLGGSTIKGKIKEFLDRYQSNIESSVQIYELDPSIGNRTTINIPILLQTSIQDLGEFSILSEDWEPGVEYKSGNVVMYNNNVWEKIEGGADGHYSDTFKEMYFSNLNDLSYYDKLSYEDTEGGLSSGITDQTNGWILYNLDNSSYNLYCDGHTESKINSFKRENELLVDNVGNKLNGIYDGRVTQFCWLDLPFFPNTTYDLTKINDNTFWGNLLTKMEFYYEDLSNQTVILTTQDFKTKTCIESIKHLIDNYGNSSVNKVIKCKITYNIGCIIEVSENEIFSIEGEEGIEYVDTVTLVPSQEAYYVDSKNFVLVNYYDMVWDKITYVSNGTEISVNKSYFKYKVKSEVQNGFINAPIVKEEYKIRTSSLENIDSNIYIQRGRSRALDNHLKLLEVKSLNSLINYGNSQFNII